MATVYLIPLVSDPQTFQIQLGANTYQMVSRWNSAPDAGWIVDFSDANTGASIIANIPLIIGADLLAGLEYLGFDGSLYVYTDGNQLNPPTIDNLGVEANLYFQTVD